MVLILFVLMHKRNNSGLMEKYWVELPATHISCEEITTAVVLLQYAVLIHILTLEFT